LQSDGSHLETLLPARKTIELKSAGYSGCRACKEEVGSTDSSEPISNSGGFPHSTRISDCLLAFDLQELGYGLDG
jgi:hypothetical protein